MTRARPDRRVRHYSMARHGARRHVVHVVRPSPARADAPEPDAWLPLLDAVALEQLEAASGTPALAPLSIPLPRDTAPAPRVHGDGDAGVPSTAGLPAVRRAPLAVRPGAGRPRPRLAQGLLLTVVLAVVGAGLPFFLSSPPRHRVTLHLDGARFVRTSRAASVGGFLASQRVQLAPGDSVLPSPTAKLRDETSVRIVRAFPVTVDVEGGVRSLTTTARTAAALRRVLRLPSDLVAVGAPVRLEAGASVVYRVPHDVSLAVDGTAGALTSTAQTVGALLAERSVSVVAGDQVDPPPDTALTDGLMVTVTHGSADRVSEDVTMPFGEETRTDSSLPEGERRLVQAGVDGVDRVTYQLTPDGRQLLGAVHLHAPEPQIVAVGSGAFPSSHHEEGSATWYATLDQAGTCAHLHIAMGTTIRVVNAETGASTTCRVADRGPESWTGHVLDLSPDVFARIAPLSAGVLAVRLEW